MIPASKFKITLKFKITMAMLLLATSGLLYAQTDTESSTTHVDLSSNKCLKLLSENDPVVVSIAFRDGAAGFSQMKELVSRNPWGAVSDDTEKEIQQQIETQSPFLIITLSKSQALTLDNHRDIIRWTLVHSTTKSCE